MLSRAMKAKCRVLGKSEEKFNLKSGDTLFKILFILKYRLAVIRQEYIAIQNAAISGSGKEIQMYCTLLNDFAFLVLKVLCIYLKHSNCQGIIISIILTNCEDLRDFGIPQTLGPLRLVKKEHCHIVHPSLPNSLQIIMETTAAYFTPP